MKAKEVAITKEAVEPEKWILSPMARIVTGYTSSIIYDFGKNRAYQISKFAGNFLEKVFSPQRNNGESAFVEWVEESDKLTMQILVYIREFITKLIKLGILILSAELQSKKMDSFEFVMNSSVIKVPILGIIELTSRCNLYCSHCYVGEKYPHRDLNFETVSRLLQEMKEIGIRSVHFTGGEVCVRQDLADVIMSAHALGFEVSLTTNGTLLSNNNKLLGVIVKCVKAIDITLYGLSKETYLRFSRDPTSLEKVMCAVDQIQAQKPEILSLVFTITPDNYKEVGEFIRFAQEKKLRHRLGKTLPVGLALCDKRLFSDPSYISCIKEVDTLQEIAESKYPIFRTRACRLDRIAILSDGRVAICPLSRNVDFELGSIYHQSLREIWLEQIRPFFASLNVDNIEICKSCEFKYLCGGECPALWNVLEPFKQSKSVPCQPFFASRKFVFNRLSRMD